MIYQSPPEWKSIDDWRSTLVTSLDTLLHPLCTDVIDLLKELSCQKISRKEAESRLKEGERLMWMTKADDHSQSAIRYIAYDLVDVVQQSVSWMIDNGKIKFEGYTVEAAAEIDLLTAYNQCKLLSTVDEVRKRVLRLAHTAAAAPLIKMVALIDQVVARPATILSLRALDAAVNDALIDRSTSECSVRLLICRLIEAFSYLIRTFFQVKEARKNVAVAKGTRKRKLQKQSSLRAVKKRKIAFTVESDSESASGSTESSNVSSKSLTKERSASRASAITNCVQVASSKSQAKKAQRIEQIVVPRSDELEQQENMAIPTLLALKAAPCPLCKSWLQTVGGFYQHMKVKHEAVYKVIKTDLIITCSCGFESIDEQITMKHNRKCDSEGFSVRKMTPFLRS